MLELRDLSFRYADGPPVLSGVDLRFEEGELVLVAGRTGVGKSTLLGVLNGLVPSFTGGVLGGEVLVDGESVLHLPPRDRAHTVGYVGQDPTAGFVTDSVEEELAYGMEQLGLDPATMRRRVEETLDLLGIAELRSRDLRTLSGGQQQRVAIGSVLTMHPRVLVLDEPTSALDPTAAEDVLATLTRLVHDLGVTVVLAEHRLERVVPFADRMVLVQSGGQVSVGEPGPMLQHSPVAPPIVELGRWAGWSPLPLSVRDARRRASRLALVAGNGAPVPVTPLVAAAPILTARNLTVGYGRKLAVRDVDLTLAPGEVTALMGRNGSGKSTLLWALQGSRKRAGGTVRVGGSDPRDPANPVDLADPVDPVDPADLDAAERRRRVGLVPQTAADLLYLESVHDECAVADRDAGTDLGLTRALLDRLAPGIDDAAHPRDLSEGQRLALVLAVVLVSGPSVVCLDEPTRGLDYPGKAQLSEILADLAGQGRAVLVATHDVEFVAQVADRVVVLAEGEVVSEGPTARVVAESPAFAPQVHKILGGGWLTVDQVVAAG